MAIIGGSTLLADGIITPSITVVSSVEGLQLINPAIKVVPIVIIIITGLFTIQQFGTENIGRFFGPIMVLWFLMLGVLGLTEIHEQIAVLKAFNPYYAIHLLVTYPGSILLLGAVFLCTTGAEALYTDLGHCGIEYKDILLDFCQIVPYSELSRTGSMGTQPFRRNYGFNRSLLCHNAHIFPAVWNHPGNSGRNHRQPGPDQRILHAYQRSNFSEFLAQGSLQYPTLQKGQMYISSINWFLWASCMLVVILFQKSDNMEAAYGLSITITMIITTFLMVLYLSMKRVPFPVRAIFFSVYTVIKGFFPIC